MRFRNYLGEQYKKEDEIDTEQGQKKVALPIVTIYLLGFILPEFETSAVRVQRQYLDMIASQIMGVKSDFIEKLSHDCFVVQLPRIKPKFYTRLDKLLSVFEQAHFVDDKKIIKKYDYEIDVPEVKNMIEILHYIGTEPEEKKQIEDEQEAWRTIDAFTENVRWEMQEVTKALEKSNKALDDQSKVIEELKRKLEEK